MATSPPLRDAFTALWPANLDYNKPGEGYLPGEYQMFQSWHDLDYAIKRTKVRQTNRAHVYASQMMGAVRVN